MQDIQNIPPPDSNPLDIEDNFGSHSDYPDIDAQDINAPRDNENTDVEGIPVPPDRQDGATPIEEPPSSEDEEGIDEDSGEPPKFL